MAGLQLKVLDVSSGIAGPFCARLLAVYGADAIKLEPPEGDRSRREGVVRGEVSALYAYLNQNKRGICADLRTTSGREALKRLVEDADIMVESFAPGTLDDLGLGYQSLRAVNPRLVMVSVTDFGQTGPYRNHRASHLTLSAAAGWMSGVGDPDREPIQQGFPIFHYIAGLNGAIGALAAARGRRQTGRGQHVDVSVFESCWVMGNETVFLSYGVQQLKRILQVPDLVKARDGWVSLTAPSKAQWQRVWSLAGMMDVLDDPDLAYDQKKREMRRPELEVRLNDWAEDKTREEIFNAAHELRIPAGIAYTPGETMGCPHLLARDFFVKVTDTKLGELMQPGAPFRSPSLRSRYMPAPGLGEHNEEVFAEIGLDQEGRRTAFSTALSQGRPDPHKDSESAEGYPDLLAGTRVADLTHWRSGPFGTCLLGSLGADVIKIESIERTDPYRYLYTDGKSDPDCFERSPVWNPPNLNKRGITLDLASEAGKALFLEIVKQSDVVVENFSPRVMRNLGLEYAKLREINPRIIMVSVSAFGQTGPWRDFVGYGATFEMIGGGTYLTGYQDGPPVRTALWSPVAGLTAAFAILMALETRELTGSGQFIDISEVEAGATFLGKETIEYQLTGQTPARIGNRHAVFAPHNAYPCQGEDEWVTIAVTSEDEWARLARLLGKPEWAEDARFATAQARKQAEDEIDEWIAEWTRGQDKRVAMELLQFHGIASGAVQRGRDLVNDPHLRARNAFKKLSRQYVGEHEYPQPPLHFSDAASEHRCAAPTLGQHNKEVLTGLLGLSSKEIERLRAAKVIGARPLGS